MDPETGSVKMFFFPFFGGGHQIPMVDTARVFASHGATSTILATPSNAHHFQKLITRDQNSGLPITIHLLITSPENSQITETDMSAGPMTDTSALLAPLRQFLLQNRPECIVVDMFHRWSGNLLHELKIKRIVFTGNGCFPRCIMDNLRNVVLENLSSDYEPFLVPGLPDTVEMTRSQIPIFMRENSQTPDRLKKMEENSFGTVINSFYGFEPAYADYVRKVLGNKAWLVGPVSLCNQSVADKTERGQASTIDEQSCLNWLNSKKPKSVIYVSFGTLARIPVKQLKEIAYGLEASDQSFIWVIGKILNSSEIGSENFLPEGFEQRMEETGKGLILRGWAPQILILEHDAVGGFVTHCGWNSTLEGVCAGVPMITWPLTAEQFLNEKLITDVLRIGVQLGSKEWGSWEEERKEVVGREKVELAVKRLMAESEEAEEIRRRVREIAGSARKAVEAGGTSYGDVDALIQELKACRLASQV